MAPAPVQTTLDLLDGACAEDGGARLSEVTFVVVDLETTGGTPADCEITEVGAVRVRGGQILGEFQSLVNPGRPVPPFVAVLTGITDLMLARAPTIDAVLPAFLEFASGAVLVAHNAPFDVGFLRAACARTGRRWPDPAVVDTARLARHVVTGEEARDRRLATLARLFRSPTVPDHRALTDARATVDVLHGLIARVGNLGVTTLAELVGFTSRVPAQVRRKRHLADDLPHAPGVYIFRDVAGRVLYVGTSVDIKTRVRSYFTASEQRTRMGEMVGLAASVTPVVCAIPLEAGVRELRLIAEHAPRYNRRSRFPERRPWVRLTREPFPRLSVVRAAHPDGAAHLGPFPSGGQAALAVAALHEAIPLRQCTRRLPRVPAADATACLLADLGRCPAPCVDPAAVEIYPALVEQARRAMLDDARDIVSAGLGRAARLATEHRFEDAAIHRDRLFAFLRTAARMQRLAPLSAIAQLVAARRAEGGGWEIVVVRHGRLAGAAVSPPGLDPRPTIESLRLSAEHVAVPALPLGAALPEETEQIVGWLGGSGARLVDVDGAWSSPIAGAGGWASVLA